MGHRTVKRVPLDFAWPLKKTWVGFVNPYRSTPCEACSRSGLNPATKELSDLWYDHEGFGSRWTYRYGYDRHGKPAERPPWQVYGDCRSWMHSITQDEVDALIEHQRLHDFTHTWTAEEGRVKRDPMPAITAAMVNEWSYHYMGHDGINQGICVETRAKRLGIWGLCQWCDGHGEIWPDAETEAKSEAWTRQEPPAGDGWQLWETTSEGSPVSPVFASAEALATWCEDGATAFGSSHLTREEWLRLFLSDTTDVGTLMVVSTPYVDPLASQE